MEIRQDAVSDLAEAAHTLSDDEVVELHNSMLRHPAGRRLIMRECPSCGSKAQPKR